MAENDLIVEYVQLPDAITKSWCIRRWHQIICCEPRLDPVLAIARKMCGDLQCAAWLLVAGTQIPIPPS